MFYRSYHLDTCICPLSAIVNVSTVDAAAVFWQRIFLKDDSLLFAEYDVRPVVWHKHLKGFLKPKHTLHHKHISL